MPVDPARLPAPVRLWSARAAADPPPQGVQLTEEGEFLVGDEWKRWSGTHVVWQDQVGFDWQAKLKTHGFGLKMNDGCSTEDAWANARLARVAKVKRPTGPEQIEAQLIRYLAEIALAPAAALLNPELRWSDAGGGLVEVGGTILERDALVTLRFDDAGDIVEATAEDRPRELDKGEFSPTPYVVTLADHGEVAGQRIPCSVEAAYDYGNGPEPFMRYRVTGGEAVEA